MYVSRLTTPTNSALSDAVKTRCFDTSGARTKERRGAAADREPQGLAGAWIKYKISPRLGKIFRIFNECHLI